MKYKFVSKRIKYYRESSSMFNSNPKEILMNALNFINKAKFSSNIEASINFPRTYETCKRIQNNLAKKFKESKETYGAIYPDEEYTKICNTKVVGTTVLVMKYIDDEPNAFTLPFSEANVPNTWIDATFIPAIKGLSTSSEFKNGKLYFKGLEYIMVYYSSALEKMCTKDEIIAVLLHEIGHHTTKYAFLFSSLISIFQNVALLIGVIMIIGLSQLGITLYGIAATSLWLNFPNSLFTRSMEYDSDSTSAALGYGEALKSALTKLDVYSESDDAYKNVTLIAKVFNKIIYSIRSILNTTDHPSLNQRISNIDRTVPVKEGVIMKYTDKFVASCVEKLYNFVLSSE